jgi:hypothetical protein
MKKIILLVLCTISLIGCSKDKDDNAKNTIIGRWHLVGFEDTVLYEFTPDFRYTFYSTDGTFGGLETAIPNPNSWVYEGNTIVIDLDFGNFSTFTPVFKCNGNVVDLVSEISTTTLFREGYDINNCNE